MYGKLFQGNISMIQNHHLTITDQYLDNGKLIKLDYKHRNYHSIHNSFGKSFVILACLT